MQSAIEYAAIPTINLTPLFLVTNPPTNSSQVRHAPLDICQGNVVSLKEHEVKGIYFVFHICASEGELLCQFCASSLQKQAIFGEMWQ